MPATFVVERNDLRRSHWVESARSALSAGDIRLRIDTFALTANNITYAAFGETMNYWRFFPCGDAVTGCIPVWGFADVIESACDGVKIGERVYGYLPMADEVVMRPEAIKPSGFVDGMAHRRELHPLYNQYARCERDESTEGALREARQALLKPLFTTSFLIDDFLADNDFFGARDIVLSSASSKTAYGTAFCLSKRRPSIRILGFTSSANVAFAQALESYDVVSPYDAVESQDRTMPSVYVDFSGDAAFRSRVHGHWRDALRYSCSVGGTHWDALGGGKGLDGPRPVLFFAPAQAKKRMADWGPGGLQQRLGVAWNELMLRLDDPGHPWLRVVRGRGRADVEATYAQVLEGRSRPDEGHMLSP